MLYAVLLGMISLGLLIRTIIVAGLDEGVSSGGTSGFRPLLRVVICIVLVLALAGLMPVLPFWLVGGAFFLVLAKALEAGWVGALVGAVLTAGSIHLGFIVMLGVLLG